ncbi:MULTISPECIES: AzlC family ABC transporter permease [unclassified Rhizobium]|uniref:AzlC family ABC transporter permease n=1 Tax=unclassified Rhizobium TaxID=2613769 RepID=UPI0006F377B4|nr:MULTISPECIES: AzlC family ABC transporter permease [unclassified Rhizobium]KQV33048.1 AzlC family protein [Rhizobium sp. Root1212]KRD21508.1 AzlC family protein [Rhizobium sp. Root268]
MDQENSASHAHWFLMGMRGIASLPAMILMLSFVGFCALTVQAGIPVEQVVFMVGAVWALPAKVILVSSMMAGANLLTAFIAVTLSSVRMMPMVAALVPEIRGRRTPTWLLLFLSHFVAITAWVYAMEKVVSVPRERRIAFFAGFGITLVLANMLLVAVAYRYVATFPPIVAGCLFFLTPVYFLASIWNSARHRVVHIAMVLGLVGGPLFYWLVPEFDILLAGLIGGTLAWAVERTWRVRQAEKAEIEA